MLLQDELAQKYKYKKLPIELSNIVRDEYLNNLPDCLSIKGNLSFKLFTRNNTLFSAGYNRIVIGDYGAFIEFDTKQIIKSNIIIKPGQEYRIKDPNFKKTVKYFWFTVNDKSNIKIYFQNRRVSYADYLPGKFYVSPNEILTNFN